MPGKTFVIVGASLAGAKAAETLRAEGFDGRIVLLGAETERPYERPSLSKAYLQGTRDGKPYVHDEGYYHEHEIELRTGAEVTAIRPAASVVTIDGGDTIRYERLLIATGAEPRSLGVDGVLTLRTMADSETLRDRFVEGARVVAIGAGWIGCEVAASARERGCEVTLLERDELPLERVLGPELGAIYRDVHLAHGVEFVGGARIEAIAPDGVQLADGRRLDADVVVAGVGVQPRVALAQAAGLTVDNGIICDAHLRTSVANIYAAGDVANALHPFYGERVRVEHWDNALHQGPAAARNMLGQDVPYDRIPYFFSDQYDVGMEYSGHPTDWDEVVFRGDVAKREFVAYWVKDGTVVAGMNVNVWDVHDDIRALIERRAPASEIPG
jgi:3-phenylpropionate/trans-cinnamate dioxygenase ferredoxin reductase subunit